MKDVVILLFLGQFKLVSLFAYQVQHSKKTERLSFQLTIPLSFKMHATQPNFVAGGVVLELDTFVVGLFLRLLYMVEVLLANGHQLSKLGG